jgi:mannose-6-phosphate isomerase-like protein (cupin superfamily)
MNQRKAQQYEQRRRLLERAHAVSGTLDDEHRELTLSALAAAMKAQSHECKHLSSIYFAGAEGDHPYFLNNDKIAVGIAVLPEDREKAGLAKRHPSQTEVIFVLSGALILEIEGEGKKRLESGAVAVIDNGKCHRIEPTENQDAVYLFVKTNPAEEPREEQCPEMQNG